MHFSRSIQSQVNLACKSDSTVLVTGPTGCGKTYLARKIHQSSRRSEKPFVVVNLASLHEGTLESELFGHEKGAFTGADQRRVGRLELAQGGTVFLDEIGDLSPKLQARLLEFLQSKIVSPIGSNRETKLDVRVIAATHKNLSHAVKKNEFREDLFFRLRVMAIHLKSLAERSEEFDGILHSTLEEICLSSGRSILRISEEVASRFESYPWPGNLRELRNVLEYAVMASDAPEIKLGDLPPWMTMNGTSENEGSVDPTLGALGVAEVALSMDYHSTLSQFEKQYLERALQRFRGRINQTARKIGINKTTLIRRIRAYGLLSQAVI